MCEIAIVSPFRRNSVNFDFFKPLTFVNSGIVKFGCFPNEIAHCLSFELDIAGI